MAPQAETTGSQAEHHAPDCLVHRDRGRTLLLLNALLPDLDLSGQNVSRFSY